MDAFLKSYFNQNENIKKQKLPGDGGHRIYIRINAEKKSFMLMSCGLKDSSLKKFISIQKRLQPFISVPKIFHQNLEKGMLLLEDLGDQSLEQFFYQTKNEKSYSFYQQALTQLIAFQDKVKSINTDAVFDKEFFLKENERAIYHLEHYLNKVAKKKVFHKYSSNSFKKDMQTLLNYFKKEDYVYCHRDYHSRNLMLKKQAIFVIDFQDAGLGPWYYDLTSLLYDSYVPITKESKKKLIKFYFESLPIYLKNKALSPSHIDFMTKLQFLQRGFKACGCFASFKNINQKETHLKYILPTLKLLKEEAFQLAYLGIYKYINKMTEILQSKA